MIPVEAVAIFANKLTGAWETTTKSMAWLFDLPDEETYPNWFYHVKVDGLDEFMKREFLLFSPSTNQMRLSTDTVLGRETYSLKFWDDNTLEASFLFKGQPMSEIFHRKENPESLFEVGK